MGSDKLHFTSVLKNKKSRSQAAPKVFAFGDLPLRRTTPEAPSQLSAMWSQIEPLGLLAWKPTGIVWDGLPDAIRRNRHSQP